MGKHDHQRSGCTLWLRQSQGVVAGAAFIGLSLAAFSPEPAHSQAAPAAAPDSSSGALQEIIVNARKRDESVQVTPVSVTATTGEALQNAQVARIDDISQFAPAVNVTQSPGEVDTINIYIRGIGNADPILTGDSPVALYVDGVYLGRTAGALTDLVDVDHIEVLRGPQGTQFGRNTSGGAVAIYTQLPSQTFGVKGEVGYASNSEYHGVFTLDTGALGESGLSARFTYRHHQMDGIIRNNLTDSANSPGSDDTNEEFASIHYEPVSNFTADLKFDNKNKSQIPVNYQITDATAGVVDYFNNSPNLGGAPFLPNGLSGERLDNYSSWYHERSHDAVIGNSLTLNYTVSDAVKLKSITAWRQMDIISHSELSNSGQLVGLTSFDPPAIGGSLPETVEPVYLYYSPYDHQHQHQWSEELQFGGQAFDLNYVAGFYYFDEHVAEQQTTLTNIPLTAPPIGFPDIPPFNTQSLASMSALNYSGTSESKAGFAQVSYAPSYILDGKLEGTVGVRYTKDQKTLNQNDTIGVRNLSHDFGNTSESASLKYQWVQSFMTYLRFSEGYKAGGFSARSQVNGDGGPSGAYLPELAKAYEIGLKGEWFDHHLRFNADIYQTNYSDLQIPRTIATPANPTGDETTNAGRSRIRGGEAELTVVPYTGWLLNASLGYVDPKYLSYVISVGPNNQLFNVANLVPYSSTSRVTVGAAGQYSFAPSPVGDLTLRTDYSYVGPKDNTIGDFTLNAAGQPVLATLPGLPYVTDATRSPGFSDIGAQIMLDNVPLGLGGKWQLSLYGKNLLDQHQKLNAVDFTGLGFIANAWYRGRVFGVNLAASF